MPPKKASAPPTTFEQLIEKVRATFVDDVALKTKLGQLGNFSEEYQKELLAADTARFKDLDLFTGLTKKVPQTPATVEKKGTKAADLKPDKPYGPEAAPPPKPPPKKRETKKAAPKKVSPKPSDAVQKPNEEVPGPATGGTSPSEKKRSRSGDSAGRQHPMDLQAINKSFVAERCKPDCSTKTTERLTGKQGVQEHLKCKRCDVTFHTYRVPTYYDHIKECKATPEKKDERPPVKGKRTVKHCFGRGVRRHRVVLGGAPLLEQPVC